MTLYCAANYTDAMPAAPSHGGALARPVLPRTLAGEWSLPNLAGGCPKHNSWAQNPQFRLVPKGGPEQTCEITVTCALKLQIGFIVLRTTPTDIGGRKAGPGKLVAKELAFKTPKWKAVESMSGSCSVPPLSDGLAYVIIPCTFDPGAVAAFELTVSSSESFTLEPLNDQRQPKTTRVTPAAGGGAKGGFKLQTAGWTDTSGCGPYCQSGPSCGGCTTSEVTASQLSAPGVDNSVTVTREGQGLSAKQESDAKAMVAAAAAAAAASAGGKYEDPAFAPGPSSLWRNGTAPAPELGIGADPVGSWRRPEEFSAEAPRLFKNEWEIEGVVPSSVLPNAPFLAAANIVAGDHDVIARCFVETEHAAQGFYVVRFFHDDPASNDDWQVVLVDDRLPCGADGKPCFARCPTEGVLWAAIVEKALAKLLGSYEATCHGSVGVEDGLVLLTGRITKEIDTASEAGAPLLATDGDGKAAAGLWAEVYGAIVAGHVVGVEHRTQQPPPGLAATGLLPNVAYCVATGGEMQQGRMMRIRALAGMPEWNGKWSDDDGAWTNQLRQLMQFSKDSKDGTFWMGFDDVAAHFNTYYFCRPADDMWARFTARSRWVDATAGGCPNYVSWRHNPQWILTVTKPTRLILTLTLPKKAGADGSALAAPPPIGLFVFRGNAAPHARRRKLSLAEGDAVAQCEPKFARRITTEVTLSPPAAGEPHVNYVVMPYAYEPGVELDFTLLVRADISDAPSEETPEARLEPVVPEEDWSYGALTGSWAASGGGAGGGGGGAPDAPGSSLRDNPQVRLAVHGQAKGKFYILVQSLGVSADMRAASGMQQGPSYPAVGVAVCAGTEDGTLLSTLPAIKHVTPAQPLDGVLLECVLEPATTPYVVMPYLADPAGAMAATPGLGYTVSVFSDVLFQLGSGGGPRDNCGYELCCFCGKPCALFAILRRLRKIEEGVDRHMDTCTRLYPNLK